MAAQTWSPPIVRPSPPWTRPPVAEAGNRELTGGRSPAPTRRGQAPSGAARLRAEQTLGHDLSRVSISAAEVGTAPSGAAAPIQLAPHWKRLLAGLGATASIGALAAGGVLASPALALAGGAGLAASAYLGYRPRMPVASVVNEHQAGQGFSGAFDTRSGRVWLRPSDREIGLLQRYSGWVNRRGGHSVVSSELGTNRSEHRGFAVTLRNGGDLGITWRSGQLNRGRDQLVESQHRKRIIEELERQTGRKVVA